MNMYYVHVLGKSIEASYSSKRKLNETWNLNIGGNLIDKLWF